MEPRRLALQAILRAYGVAPSLATEIQRAAGEVRVAPRAPIRSDGTASAAEPAAPRTTLASIRYQLERVPRWEAVADAAARAGQSALSLCLRERRTRLLGWDAEPLGTLAEDLRAAGYPKEGDAVRLLYGPRSDAPTRDDALRAALDAGRVGPPAPTDAPFAILDDRRASAPPRVALIVSLYNAEHRLEHFLRRLREQTLLRRDGALEIILVDSASPTNERAVASEVLRSSPLPVLYARTERRETIQMAWNRGIALARAPYLAFWGVDEGAPESGLETLAERLDRSDHPDWVQGDAVAHEYDVDARWLREGERFTRGDASRALVRLDHTHLTWVGAMYRRSLHERFGYYDPSYSAAGDLEFKFRVLPFIDVAFLPTCLGEYWNYPDGRVTAHPRGEVEEIRAHLVHRTAAGLRYAFAHEPVEELVRCAELALRFRRCTATSLSSDAALARLLFEYAHERAPADPVAAAGARLTSAWASALQSLDVAASRDVRRAAARLPWVVHQGLRFMAAMRRHTGGRCEPACWVFNDARYERNAADWAQPRAPRDARDTRAP